MFLLTATISVGCNWRVECDKVTEKEVEQIHLRADQVSYAQITGVSGILSCDRINDRFQPLIEEIKAAVSVAKHRCSLDGRSGYTIEFSNTSGEHLNVLFYTHGIEIDGKCYERKDAFQLFEFAKSIMVFEPLPAK